MRYAEISVNSPVAQRRTFSYSIPAGMNVREGQAVLVPFGERTLQGIVIELVPHPSVEETRDIAGIIEPELVLPASPLELARWISGHYLSPLFETLGLMLPPGFERNAVTFLQAAKPGADVSSLSDDQQRVLEIIGDGRIEQKAVEKALGKKRAATNISQLVRQGVLSRSYELAPVRIKPKKELHIQLAGFAGAVLNTKQAELVELLQRHPGGISWAEARKQTGVQKPAATALEKEGIVAFRDVEVPREPISYENIRLSQPLTLTPAQQKAYDTIEPGLRRTESAGEVFLLHGVTGSGKTEVYLQALAEAVRQGRKGIVLVPEIAMTPQTIERFAARFPHRVAVLHSRLTLGEQYDEWRRIRDGEFDVVIGSRSAVFAPQPDLGIIVLDEEHEWTYKQDNTPHYHARDAAIKLAELTGTTVVLGSATPDVETYFKAKNGTYQLLELPERIAAAGGALPPVDIVDMRDELKAGNSGIFSRDLAEAVNEAISHREQVILFLNRRGGSTFIQCRSCGFVLRCRRCEVPLSHHISGD
ncbi:MAG: primosomal protein N', partial [Dehalococcoidales bacterium]|nr:primosomal protein N' [Dehalococcoidales bacterium]